MGSPEGEGGRDGDEAQHEVQITRDFCLLKTEVTQGQWEALMGNNPSRFKDCGEDCPVEYVNWWEAVSFVNALSARKGLEACYELVGCAKDKKPGEEGFECRDVRFKGLGCEGWRLPTEAEWEFAARAGTATAFYNGGITDLESECGRDGNLDKIGWHCGNASGKTHAVAGKDPNAWGLYDMLGNCPGA